MPILEYTLTGFDGADRMLAALGEEAERIANKVIDEAAAVVAAKARELAPRRAQRPPDAKTRLADTIVVARRLGRTSQKKYGGRARIERFIGPTAATAHLVEFGHVLVKQSTRRISGTRELVTKRVIGHVPAHPFMRPAAAITRDEVLALMARRFGEEAQKTAARWARNAARGTLAPRAAAALLPFSPRLPEAA